jgi:hypothetical protein
MELSNWSNSIDHMLFFYDFNLNLRLKKNITSPNCHF